MKKILLASAASLLFAANQVLLPNTKIVYKNPPQVKRLSDMLSKAKVYARVRAHYIAWDWKRGVDNWGAAIGGSLIYKTAYYNGFGVTLGWYTAQNPWHFDRFNRVKSPKDTFSRYRVAKKGDYGMSVVAQGFVEYKRDGIDIRYGRQLIDTMLVKANDSKMIPNAFEGISAAYIWGYVRFYGAYLSKQKLRDKTFFHDVITFGKDENGDGKLSGYEKWANNDDAGVNRALSYINLQRAGKKTKHHLLIGEVRYKDKKRLLTLNATVIPTLFGLYAIEPKTKIDFSRFTLIPTVRYIYQKDLGAKDLRRIGVGVANLKGNTIGYKNPFSLDSWLLNARIDFKPKKSFWWARIAYSQVADKADIVDPWRGFPTGGYTRAMAQYNWYAGTKSYMGRVVVDWQKAGLVEGLWSSLRIEHEDFDDKKPGVQADCNAFNLDLFERVPGVKGLYVKLRLGATRSLGSQKPDTSFNELRFEINYLL